MKKYVKANNEDYYTDIVDEVTGELEDYIISGQAWSYDDVASETYAQIQDLAYDYGIDVDSDDYDGIEDEIYEEVIDNLVEMGYIAKDGRLLYESEE